MSGNTIAFNGSNGVELRWSSHAMLTGNTITGNGSNPPSGAGVSACVHVRYSVAGFEGLNVITNNAGVGIGAFAGLVDITGATTNGNGNGNDGGGVAGNRGATILLDSGTVSGNAASGVGLALNVTARINSTPIYGNSGPNGIDLRRGAVVTLGPPTVSGTAGSGPQCCDGESGYAGLLIGTISPACSGF